MSFYSGRTTHRYDVLTEQELRSKIEWLTSNGYRPYIVLDGWEERDYNHADSF